MAMENDSKSLTVETELEKFLAIHDLNLTVKLEPERAYAGADHAIVATPPNYDCNALF